MTEAPSEHASSAHLEPAEVEEEARFEAQDRVESSANWFFWLAGLSMVNSVILLAGGDWSFIFGLGITQIVDAFVALGVEEAPEASLFLKGIGLSINVVIAGVVVLFGWLARRQRAWVFALGMLFYTLDAGLFLMVGDYLGLAFHAFVLTIFFGGWRACRRLAALPSAPSELDAEAVAPA